MTGDGVTTGPPTTAPGPAVTLSGIDATVRAAQGVSVDPSVLPALAADMPALAASLARWAQPVRSTIAAAMTDALARHTAVLKGAPAGTSDPAALSAYATRLDQAVRDSTAVLTSATAVVEPLREALDRSIGSLRSDVQSLAAMVATKQGQVDTLNEEIEDDQEMVEEAHEDPMRFLLSGGPDIVSIISQLNTYVGSLASEQAALDRLQGVNDALTQLIAAGGALGTLSSTLSVLSTALVDVQTSLAQVGNTLQAMVSQPPLPAILAAQLQTAVTDLSAADATMTALVGTS